eukprot:gene14152-30130_t
MASTKNKSSSIMTTVHIELIKKEHEIMSKGLEELNNLMMISSKQHIQYQRGRDENHNDNTSSYHTSTISSYFISTKLAEIQTLLVE